MPAMLPSHKKKNSNGNANKINHKRKNPPADQQAGGSNMFEMAFQRGGRGRGRGNGAGRGQQHADTAPVAGTRGPQTYEEYRDIPCWAHIDQTTGKPTHTNRHCKWVNDLKTDPEAGYQRARKPWLH